MSEIIRFNLRKANNSVIIGLGKREDVILQIRKRWQ